MTNYSDNPGMVRVDFFKTPGKWYMTEAWDMSDFYDFLPGPWEAVEEMLGKSERGRSLMFQFTIIVLEPYHKNAYPIMLVPEYARQVVLEARKRNDEKYNPEYPNDPPVFRDKLYPPD